MWMVMETCGLNFWFCGMWILLLIFVRYNVSIKMNTPWQYFLYGNFVLSYGPFWVNKFYTKLHKKTNVVSGFFLTFSL